MTRWGSLIHGEGSARGQAEVMVEVRGGQIRYYAQGVFTATCTDTRHGRCVLTRSARPGRRTAQGRPLGLLLAWLAAGTSLDSKAEHWGEAMQLLTLTLGQGIVRLLQPLEKLLSF